MHKARGNGSDQNHHEKCDHNKVNCFSCEGWRHMIWQYSRTPLNENPWEVTHTPQPAPWNVQLSRGESGMLIITNKPAAEPGYHNPSPLVWLVGCPNEVTVVVEDVEMMALVDTGSRVSTLMEGFCLEFGLKIFLWGIVTSQGNGGILIPYKGYIETNLIISDLTQYNEDVLFLVVSDHKYGEWVPVQLGTLVIDPLVVIMTLEELQQACGT